MLSAEDDPTTQSDIGDDWLAIDLRTRLLECILAGALPTSEAFAHRANSEACTKSSIGLRAERIVSQLRAILDTKPNDVIRRFVESYDLNEPLLHLPNPLAAHREVPGATPLPIQEKLSLVFEAESEIVQLERDLREIEVIDGRGFVGAGKLADGDLAHSELRTSVVDPLVERSKTIGELERRATALMSRYDSYVNSLSEIFISWDAILTSVEEDLLRLQQK